MKLSALVLLFCASTIISANAQAGPDWPQWGRTPQHNGSSPAVGQSPSTKLASVTYDPFVAKEQAEEGGELLAHYQAPLIDGNSVFLEVKTGTYVSCNPPGSGVPFPCGPDAWNSQIWNERSFSWQGGDLVQQWTFASDWKPVPNAGGLGGWEPVFHAALGHGFVFVPGFGGSIYKLNESDGSVIAHFRPFGNTDDPNKFVSGPLSVDRRGNVYYNVIFLQSSNPWTRNIRNAWLVRVSSQGVVRKVSYTVLVPDAPTNCSGAPCGSQRPGVNVAPAISSDGNTIYTISRAHFASDFDYVIAANADLTPKWHTSMRNLGMAQISGVAFDQSSSSPTVTPNGSILYGALGGQTSGGNLLKFSTAGTFQGSYPFGWDTTPAVRQHDGTYSIILKDNHYDTGGPYFITQLDANLVPEWHFRSPTNTEWCVNAPAVDANGTVYANSEDGNVYVINPDGTFKGKLFLRVAIGAAYTPIAIGLDGKIYTENDGDMFVVGQ